MTNKKTDIFYLYYVAYMNILSVAPAEIAHRTSRELVLSGCWTACTIDTLVHQFALLARPFAPALTVDAGGIQSLDTAGAWILQNLLQDLHKEGIRVQLRALRPEHARLMEVVGGQILEQSVTAASTERPRRSLREDVGRKTVAMFEENLALLSFIGVTSVALATAVVHPARLRWRPVLYNIRTAGFDALPIVGMLSFLLGVVVAYQGADQLRRYGANIFVADLVGYAMLREFAPLITAIIVAGRSGSAYAAQIGTMAVTDEIDAMRTIGIAPIDMLVLPKIIALLIALPLLTVFADVLGVFGGMIMAYTQLDVGFREFLDRFVNAISISSYLVGIGKAPVFALIIAGVGCFQGFRTKGGADSVGRQTTRAVVQSIFLVIVADAVFSVAFSVLGL